MSELPNKNISPIFKKITLLLGSILAIGACDPMCVPTDPEERRKYRNEALKITDAKKEGYDPKSTTFAVCSSPTAHSLPRELDTKEVNNMRDIAIDELALHTKQNLSRLNDNVKTKCGSSGNVATCCSAKLTD